MLRRLHLLDTPAEEAFDRISRLAAKILHVPVALVSLVDANRQFLKSCVGLQEPWGSWRETPLDSSYCKHVVASGKPLVLTDARDDPMHRANKAISNFGAVSYLGCPLTVDDQPLGSFCVIDTERHEWSPEEISIVEDLAQAVMAEIVMRANADEHAAALRAREQMMAVVSHDLRAPLQSILTAASLLELDVDGDDALELLGTVRASAGRMNRLIGDLLEVSALEFDKLSVETQPVPVGEMLNEIHSAVGERAADAELSLELDVESELTVLADRDRILQVLQNLVDNALRLTPSGGTVTLAACGNNGEVLVSVEDSGPGISDDALEHIFDWGWHATRKNQGGTGLGLSIAKGIVTAHGGWIEAANCDGGGARFTFSLSRA